MTKASMLNALASAVSWELVGIYQAEELNNGADINSARQQIAGIKTAASALGLSLKELHRLAYQLTNERINAEVTA